MKSLVKNKILHKHHKYDSWGGNKSIGFIPIDGDCADCGFMNDGNSTICLEHDCDARICVQCFNSKMVEEIANTKVNMDENGLANRWSSASISSDPVLMKQDIDYLIGLIRSLAKLKNSI